MSVPRLCRAQQLLERGCACRLSTRYADCRPQMRDDKQRDTVVRTHIDGSAGGNNFALCLMSPSSKASLQHDCYSLLEAVHIRQSCIKKCAKDTHKTVRSNRAKHLTFTLHFKRSSYLLRFKTNPPGPLHSPARSCLPL